MAPKKAVAAKTSFTKAEATAKFNEHNQTETVLHPHGEVKAAPPAEGDECECAACTSYLNSDFSDAKAATA